ASKPYIVSNEDFVFSNIEKYVIHTFKDSYIREFISKVKNEILNISFPYTDLHLKSQIDRKYILEDDKCHQTDQSYDSQDNSVMMSLCKLKIVKESCIIYCDKKVTSVCLFHITREFKSLSYRKYYF
ncbi:hypothetical protein CWI37_2391p0010, partial [Hamiltosporidium tvaerminnensis]